jgi:hypothetical protein
MHQPLRAFAGAINRLKDRIKEDFNRGYIITGRESDAPRFTFTIA